MRLTHFTSFSPDRFSIGDVLLAPPDAGAGTGGSPASGTPGGGAPAGGTPAAGGGGTPAAGGSPFSLSDDAVVTINGQTGKWSEIRDSHYVPRANYDRGIQYLNTVAAHLDTREQALVSRITQAQQGRGATGQPIAENDPFAELEGMPLVDGKSLAQAARKLMKEGFGPQSQALNALAAKVTALEKQQGTVVQSVNGSAQRDAEAQFETWTTNTLTSLQGVKGLPEGVSIDPKDPFMRELTRDLYLSHEEASWKSQQEFVTALGSRVAQAIAFVRGLDKAAVDAGHERRRRFLDPRKGTASPGNEKPYAHMRGDNLARMLFSGADAAGRT